MTRPKRGPFGGVASGRWTLAAPQGTRTLVPMFSLDRRPVAPITRLVYCPIRDRDVSLERCAACPRKIEQDPHDPPRYIVCEARRLTGWLGMDASVD